MPEIHEHKPEIHLDVASFTIREITDIHESLLTALADTDVLHLDLDDDAQVDLSFLQLILSARRYAAAHGKSLHLARPVGDGVRAVLERAGLIARPTPDVLRFWFHQEVAA